MLETETESAGGILTRKPALFSEPFLLLKNKFLFQSMTVADLEKVVAIEVSCYPHPWRHEQFLQELNNPVSQIDLLRAEGQLCGYLCSWLIAGELQILNVATAPDWRRQGVADRLLTRVFERCLEEGLTSAWLEVREGNLTAINLYRRHGFVVAGARKGYYRDGENALLMVREFT